MRFAAVASAGPLVAVVLVACGDASTSRQGPTGASAD